MWGFELIKVVPSLGHTYMGHELSNDQLVSQAAGQEKLCLAGSMETELPGETHGAGSSP